MPLQTPYGVLSGPVERADLLSPSGGQWPHYHVWVRTPLGTYDSAINLKSLTDIRIEYRTRVLERVTFAGLLGQPDGWHPLAQTPTSGALDYVRLPAARGTTGWRLQTGQNLIDAMRTLLNGCTRIHIFGAAYSTGLGVHDVHMNQGDPPDSEFAPLDAIWQDGGLIVETGTANPATLLQIKFETQSLHTDAQGHPIFVSDIPPLYVPFWRWPPDNPLSARERQLLTDDGLVGLAALARSLPELGTASRSSVRAVLHAELAARLPEADAARIDAIAGYVEALGRVL
ncbi:MAG: DUF2278 family protein [Leifsonia sp.]|uniref:DUF2278 family protein n=1 Tax=Leifsonia sp. TaxID=1870902 RepID=UPI003F7E3A5B